MASLFDVNENGEIIFEQNGIDGSDVPSDPEIPDALEFGNEVFDSGNDVIEIDGEGITLPDTLENPEIYPEEQETGESGGSDINYSINLLSDEIEELLVNALTPASGTLGSSTLDYFDRIVSGLPSDAVYIAYRINSGTTGSYDGVLYYSRDYDIENNVVSFGDDTTQVRVVRSSYNGQNNVTQYYESDADGASVAFDMHGDVVYYTNAVAGYPILGGIPTHTGYSPFLVGAVLCALFTTVLHKLILKK